MAEINDFNVTDASNTARWPESMAPSAVNDAARADEGILARWYKDTNGSLTSGGSSNAYTLSINSTDTVYDGQVLAFEANHANTGAATLNVTNSGGSAQGAEAIVWPNGTALSTGEIPANAKVQVVRDQDNTRWLLWTVSVPPSGAATTETLTNKTIDGDDNTVQDLDFSAVIKTEAGNADKLAGYNGSGAPVEISAGTGVSISGSTISVTSAADATARNAALSNSLRISALEGAVAGLPGGWVDAFETEAGVDAATSANEYYDATNDLYSSQEVPQTSYSNTGGEGDRTASIPNPSVSFTLDSGNVDNLIDGDLSANATGAIDGPGTGSTAIAAGEYIRFDFVTAKYIDEMKIQCASGWNPTGVGQWKVQGSTNASDWDDIATFTWDQVITTISLPDVPLTGYRYWQIVEDDSGVNWLNTWIIEFTFKIADGASAAGNMDLISDAGTADSAPTEARLVAQISSTDSITINTDVVAKASRDNGTTWETGTFTKIGEQPGGVDEYAATFDLSGQPSGTAPRWRIDTENTKSVKIHGVAFQTDQPTQPPS